MGYGNGDEEGYGSGAILLAGNKSDLESQEGNLTLSKHRIMFPISEA